MSIGAWSRLSMAPCRFIDAGPAPAIGRPAVAWAGGAPMASLREAAMASQGLALRGGPRAAEAGRERAAQGPRAVRDGLRPLGAAAYRHLRRGAADDHDPARLRGDLGHPHAAGGVLGRPRRDAEGPRQRAQPGDAAPAPAAAADHGARPVRDARELRAPQQRDAAALPRHLRLRVRVRLGHRVLPLGRLRRDAAAGGRALRRDHGDHAGVACARSGSRPIPASCRSTRRRGACSTCRSRR